MEQVAERGRDGQQICAVLHDQFEIVTLYENTATSLSVSFAPYQSGVS
jgi:hypothetical protein